MNGARSLLVVGIHREERAFGEAVAEDLDRGLVDVLVIPDGLSGRRPRPDEKFAHDVLHRALYQQLLPHVLRRHHRLIDLHTGADPQGPCADLICACPEKLAGLAPRSAAGDGAVASAPRIRLLALGNVVESGAPVALADMSIPEEIWRNPHFDYVGVEIFLADPRAFSSGEVRFARDLVAGLAGGL
jgi:hypothetical protein